jgi:hypothetical protein
MNDQINSPQEKLPLNMLHKHLVHIEAKDVSVKFISDYFKNYLICSALLWGGIEAFSSSSPLPINVFVFIGGIVLIAASIWLCILNVAYGFEAYSKLRKLESVSNFTVAFIGALTYCLILAILLKVKNS